MASLTQRFLPIVNFVLGFSAVGLSAGILLPHQGGLDAKIEAVRLAHEHSFAHHLQESKRRFDHVEKHVVDLVLQQARLESVLRAKFPEAKAELDAPLPEAKEAPAMEVVEMDEAVPVVELDVIPGVVVEELVLVVPEKGGVEVADAEEAGGPPKGEVALVAEGEGNEVKVVGGDEKRV